MPAKRKRSYDVVMKLQAVDVAETTSKEAAATQFSARALAERNKRRPGIKFIPGRRLFLSASARALNCVAAASFEVVSATSTACSFITTSYDRLL